VILEVGDETCDVDDGHRHSLPRTVTGDRTIRGGRSRASTALSR
jgi:hypothetical protein